MINNHVAYLRELQDWSNALRKNINTDGIPEEMMNEWRSWDEDIGRLLETGTDFHQLSMLQKSGERLWQELNGAVLGKKEIPIYGGHKLPPLPYSYDALEPYIEEEIMRLHHLKHHQSYVDGLNKAEREIYFGEHDSNTLRHWLRDQAFHGSGHLLHSIFWKNMTPNSTKVPINQIEQQINIDFGSFENFKQLFTNVAASVQGPGWAALLYDPVNKRLMVESIEKHQVNHLVSMIPLLVLDVWEHAYYLQYKTEKADYVEAWWNIVNWQDVNDRLGKAKGIHSLRGF